MKEQNIISSLVELSRQRDQVSIKSKLLSALIEITNAAWLVICEFDDLADTTRSTVVDRIPNQDQNKAVAHYPDELFTRLDSFRACANSKYPVWVQDLEQYEAIIFKLPGKDKKNEFVVLFNDKVLGRDERIVTSILDLYDNFHRLVMESTHDSLTHLLNRGAFDFELPEVLLQMNQLTDRRRKPRLGQKSVYLVMIDIDHFKRINDQLGHLYGDEVILIFANVFREILEPHDRIYRYGGEEFSAIIEDISFDDVSALMEELRIAIAEYDFPQLGQVTISIGVTELLRRALPSTLVDYADRALYAAKDAGRNQIQFFNPSMIAEPKMQKVPEEVFF